MADRIAIMNEGVLHQVDAPQAVYARPANLFVAQFIGSPPMSTITGPVGAPFGGSDTVTVGFRPEHLELVPVAEGAIAGTVAVVESLGHEQHVIVRLADGQLVTARIPASVDAPRVELPVGLNVRTDRLHRFQTSDGARIDG